jgi:hypothetical protein
MRNSARLVNGFNGRSFSAGGHGGRRR